MARHILAHGGGGSRAFAVLSSFPRAEGPPTPDETRDRRPNDFDTLARGFFLAAPRREGLLESSRESLVELSHRTTWPDDRTRPGGRNVIHRPPRGGASSEHPKAFRRTSSIP